MLKGVVFDLDGTLVDSEIIWGRVLQQIVESFGKTWDPSLHKTLQGTPAEETMRLVKERFDLPASDEDLVCLHDQTFARLTKTTPPPAKVGAEVFLRALQTAEIPFALATSADRALAESVLTAHGWLDLFAAIVTGDEVTHGKPAPDIYLEATRRLAFAPETCVAFEDAIKGVESAKAAGLKVVGVVDPRFVKTLPSADRLIQTFDEITVDEIKHL